MSRKRNKYSAEIGVTYTFDKTALSGKCSADDMIQCREKT